MVEGNRKLGDLLVPRVRVDRDVPITSHSFTQNQRAKFIEET
jgi:hypothetical protein